MASINHFDLRSFDLNLLIAFDALMEERTVTRAAARLKVQQPAMSHSLATLRLLLQDELFVRVGQAMQPTARAQALAPRIRDALRQVQETLGHEDGFDPATQGRVFRLGFSSELELLVMPDLAARLRRSAPGIRLMGRLADRDEVHHLLDEGMLDVAVGCFDHGTSRHHGVHLFEQSLACCFHPDLLQPALPIDIDTYVGTCHALVTLRDSLQGCLSDALERLDVRLNVVMATSDFLSVLAAAAQAPILATLPARMAARYAPKFGLSVGPVPLDLRVPAVSMVWSSRTDRDPGSRWLREQVTGVLADHSA
ncbi:MAG: LysR family transcriptional regulator [Gemmatimonadaceae bacterium]|nr:LysR family transcriptional regulator [Acetobacteraceae bacterium]